MSRENIAVSIIIPVYNAERYIAECIESVLSEQNINFELIIINDGSTDQSDDIIREYCKDDRILYLLQSNSGVSKARNVGLDHAHGDYVIFVDADDYIPQNSLSTRIKAAKLSDFLISRYYRVSPNGNCIVDRIDSGDNTISVVEALATLTTKSTIGYQGFIANKVFRRSIIEQNHIQFDTNIAYGEDRLFIAEYISHCNSICVNSDCVYYYRTNNAQATSSFSKITSHNSVKVLSEFEGLEKLKSIIEKYDVNLARYVLIRIFFVGIRLAKNADADARSAKNICMKEAWKSLKCMLLFPNDFYGPKKKIKAIGHFLLQR